MLFSFVEASEGEQKANDLHAYYNKIEPPGTFILSRSAFKICEKEDSQ